MTEKERSTTSLASSPWLPVDFCSGLPDDFYVFPKSLKEQRDSLHHSIESLQLNHCRRPKEDEVVVVDVTEKTSESQTRCRTRGRLIEWLATDLAFLRLMDLGYDGCFSAEAIFALPVEPEVSMVVKPLLETPAMCLHCRLASTSQDELSPSLEKMELFEQACAMPQTQLQARLIEFVDGNDGEPEFLAELTVTFGIDSLMALLSRQNVEELDKSVSADGSLMNDDHNDETYEDMLREEESKGQNTPLDPEKEDYTRRWVETCGSRKATHKTKNEETTNGTSMLSECTMATSVPIVSLDDVEGDEDLKLFDVLVSENGSFLKFWIVPIDNPGADDFIAMDAELQSWANDEALSRTLPIEVASLPQNSMVTAQKPSELKTSLMPLWYRAELVFSIQSTSEAFLLFVDEGSSARVGFSHIKRLPKRFTTTPRLALPATLVGLDGIQIHNREDDVLTTRFNDIVACNNVIKAAVVRRGPINDIELQSYNSKLHLDLYYCEEEEGLRDDLRNGQKNLKSINEELIDLLRPKGINQILEQKVMSWRDHKLTEKRQKLLEKAKVGRVCKFFARSGRCRYGDSCQFVHQQTNEDVTLYDAVPLQINDLQLPSPRWPKVHSHVFIQVTCARDLDDFNFILPYGPFDVSKKEEIKKHQNQNETLTSLMNDMNSFYTDKVRMEKYDSKIATKEAVIGSRDQLLAIMNPKDNKWYRAQLIGFGAKLRVVTIDYGDVIEDCSLDHTFALEPRYCHLPRQAFRGCLSHIKPQNGHWSEEASKVFCDIIFSSENIFIVASVDKVEDSLCFLKLTAHRHNEVITVQEKLVECGFASF